MKYLKAIITNYNINASLYFGAFPLLYIIYHLEFFLFFLLLSTILSQTRFEFAEVFYYVKWSVLIGFVIFEYLLLNFINLRVANYQKVSIPKSIILLFIFLIYISIMSLYSIEPTVSLFKSGTFFLLIFSCLILIPYLVQRLERYYELINILYFFAGIIIVLNVFAFFFYPLKVISPYVQVRFRGYLENPNTLGMICFISLPLFLYKYKTALSRRKKIIPMILIMTSITLPVIAFSRASVLGIVIILAIYFYYYNRKIFVVGLIFSLIVVVVILSSPILLELLRLADDPLSQRDKVWELGMKAWNEHILFGAGYGTTHIVTSEKYTFMQKGITEFLLGKHFNNIYLEILFETGISGILLFLLILILLIKETNQNIKEADGDTKIFNVCYFSVLIAVIFQSFFESFILSAGNTSSIIFWTMTGLVISVQREHKNKYNYKQS